VRQCRTIINNQNTFDIHVSDETKRIGARVPIQLLDDLRQAGYDSPTEAILQGFELLVSASTGETINNSCETPEHNKEIESLQNENLLLKGHIETLKKELDDIKAIHNNYMLQMQTLINQRALEPPAAEKKKPFWKFW
jgi:hypothetical protein